MPNKELFRTLADNKALLDAVKKLVLSHFEDVPYSEGASDELLGQIARARHIGRQKVEAAFREIDSFKTPTKAVDKNHPGR